MPEKIIRDPVHDVIAFRTESPVDVLLFRLINAAEFQRLRRIRQLGLASLAYPGADHSRYSHSLGVMETARKIIAQLRRNFTISEEDETVVLAASLLHDLGHGPFSHVFERVTGVHHELLTQRVVLDPDSEVHRVLFQHEKLLPERIVNFLRCKPKRTYHCDILSSQLDADRLDYLLRDNLMTGSGYGDYDLGWLLHALTVDTGSDRLAVTFKGVSAVEAYLQSRYHMYRNVYFHKVVRSAEGMVKLALQRAKRLAVQGRLNWPDRESVIDKALTGQRMTMDEFRDLDDISVSHCFKEWCDPAYGDATLAMLCRGLLFRGLFKTIDLSHLSGEEAKAVFARAEQAVAAAGGEPKYDLFYDEPANTPYEVLQEGGGDTGKEILVVERGGKVTPFGQISPLTTALNQQLMFRRIHFNAEYRAAGRTSGGPIMNIEVRKTTLPEILGLRDMYCHEMHCQVMCDSLHDRPGWTQPYLLTIDGAPAGHGAVTFGGPWKDNPTIFEFFVVPPQRRRLFDLFAAFVDAAGTRRVETQTNGTLLAVLAQSFCDHLTAEAILFEDRFTTALEAPGVQFRKATPGDAAAIAAAKLDEGAQWVLEQEGQIVATGGLLYHYNRPYGDIYMAVAEPHRRRGLGAYLVQELKRVCYEGGSVPAARCNVDNVPSRATLQKAGLVPCGTRVFGTLSDAFMQARR